VLACLIKDGFIDYCSVITSALKAGFYSDEGYFLGGSCAFGY